MQEVAGGCRRMQRATAPVPPAPAGPTEGREQNSMHSPAFASSPAEPACKSLSWGAGLHRTPG